MILLFYILAILALAIGTAAIYMALSGLFPVQWLYYHYFIRKPAVWTILGVASALTIGLTVRAAEFPVWAVVPLIIMALGVVLTYKMHQDNAFKALDFPGMAQDISNLPIRDDMQLGVIEYAGVTKAYPLDYVIHHHVINDQFGDRLVALSYCAMCRSIIPFDVTDIGPLFVGSYKNANLIVADRKTKTFFQQATFDSIIGKLHPHTLTMIPFQTLSWADLKKMNPIPQVVKVTQKDFKEFQLPIPGVWRKIIASEATPGLSAQDRDKTFPARTLVVGIIDPTVKSQVVYLKEELIKHGVTTNQAFGFIMVAFDTTVLVFRDSLNGRVLSLTLNPDKTLSDLASKTVWNLRGKQINGEIAADLIPVAISEEYWFSWKKFHANSQLIRL